MPEVKAPAPDPVKSLTQHQKIVAEMCKNPTKEWWLPSDLMKVTHYLRDGVKVAIVAEDKELSEKLAGYFVQADELTKDFQTLTRKIVD